MKRMQQSPLESTSSSTAGIGSSPLSSSESVSRNYSPAPIRRSIHERIAQQAQAANPLVDSSLSLLDDVTADTGTFRVDMTGELVEDNVAPLPVLAEPSSPRGELDLMTAKAHHLLLLPETASADDLEALAISVWNEAGWLTPGLLRLQEGATLEGPWVISKHSAKDLGLDISDDFRPHELQVWLLRCPTRRGAAPIEEIREFNEWARAFPEGMPIGLEERVLEALQRVARRLYGTLRIAGSGYLMSPDPESSVNLRVYASAWLPPEETEQLLKPHIPDVYLPGPPPATDGAPYAFMGSAGTRSQVLIGVRTETTAPRALRWEIWAKERLYLYEIVWALPEDLYQLDQAPTRAGRLERTRASAVVETAAAVLADKLNDPLLGGAAVIDEDGFLVALDVPPQEEEQQRP